MNGGPGRGWLSPLSSIYDVAAGMKNAAYDRRWLRPRRLEHPVISIGSLSVGGAGKTPVVIRLAELLAARGVAVSVLSRGYGRKVPAAAAAVETVDPRGLASRFGDEPLLMARRFAAAGAPSGSAPVNVVVGADRYAAGMLAEQAWRETGPAVHLLDDGFQHRRLGRDLDVVLLHRSDFEERLLPAGRLREPLSSLRRADVIVLREEDHELAEQLRGRDVQASVWFMRRSLRVPAGAEPAVAFCGIARPAEFFGGLRAAGMELVAERSFRDHQPYSAGDVERLRQLASGAGARRFITTEKDAVRLESKLLSRLTSDGRVPVETAELEMVFTDEDAIVEALLSAILGHKEA